MAIHAPLDIPKVLGKGIVELDGYFTLASGGAVSAVAGKGFTTSQWTDNGTGDATITLPGQGALIDIYGCCLQIEDASQDLVVVLKVVDAAARTVRFEFQTLAGANANPTVGAKLRFHFRIKNSSVS